MPFFEFPEDARWNPDRDAVEFSVILRPYEGTVRIARRVFQRLLDQSPTPERCMEAFHLQRTRFELIVERKLRRRQLLRHLRSAGGEKRSSTIPIVFLGLPRPPSAALRYWNMTRQRYCRRLARS
jgi:hypothetical protein